MTNHAPLASIVLCAGKGKRMQAPQTPKVCFPIMGKPAILHLLETLHGNGVAQNVLVVGHLAGKVVDEVGPAFPATVFTYQAELRGTGHATRQGATLLRGLGFDGGILVVAGDKVIEPRALRRLTTAFRESGADLALLVAPKDRWPSAGRIVTGADGQVLRIVEQADIRAAAESGQPFEVAGEALAAEALEARVTQVNQAVYLFRASALYDALDHLSADNVQGEEYLTDSIDFLVRRGGRVVPVAVDEPEDVLGFNSLAELLQIEEHFRKKAGIEVGEVAAPDPRIFKPAAEWAKRLATGDGPMDALLTTIYGGDRAYRDGKRQRLLRTVELFIERFGSEGEVAVIRAPGRINLMGRHVDHRGGCVNQMAIDREHVLVARRRSDTTVRAQNEDRASFEDLEFTGGELLQRVRLDKWRDFVDSEPVLRMVRDMQGNWGNYLQAPMLRLQQEFKDRQIRGVDCVVSGDIPMAAGLSSSSALVVAMAEALVLTNRLDVAPRNFVDLCGEGEWFVGTRGGSADHAAIKLSQFGQVANVGFFPFEVKEYVPFPPGYAVIVCNSWLQAKKAAGARQTFNERVAAYELAVHVVRKRFPNYAPLIEHLRDIAPDGLRARATDVYRILLDVPETMSAEDIRNEIGAEAFERITAMHEPLPAYPLRTRLLFGIAECERSKQCINYLKRGALESFGWLMRVSHDGDRVVTADGTPYFAPCDDFVVQERIADLQSEDPDRVLAGQLYAQPGGYACSVPQIDLMVDTALATPGVVGAQLSGAGLGGCMMVLTREDAVDAVLRRMNDAYYVPNGLESGAWPVAPSAGCCALALEA